MNERSANTLSITAFFLFAVYLVWMVATDTPEIYLNAPDWALAVIDWPITGFISLFGALLLSLSAAAFHVRCVVQRIRRPLHGSILGWVTVALFLYLLFGVLVVWHFLAQ